MLQFSKLHILFTYHERWRDWPFETQQPVKKTYSFSQGANSCKGFLLNALGDEDELICETQTYSYHSLPYILCRGVFIFLDSQ